LIDASWAVSTLSFLRNLSKDSVKGLESKAYVEHDRHPLVPDHAFGRHVADERKVCLPSLLREYTVDWPARSVHPAFKPSFGVRATQLPVETVRESARASASDCSRKDAFASAVAAFASNRSASGILCAGRGRIFVGRLGQDRQLVRSSDGSQAERRAFLSLFSLLLRASALKIFFPQRHS